MLVKAERRNALQVQLTELATCGSISARGNFAPQSHTGATMKSYLQADHRADYVKFVLRAPIDLCEHYKLKFVEIVANGEEYDGADSGYHVKPVCKHKDGNWSYAYEIYGPLAQVVRYFDWKAWSPLLQRFDVKFDLDLSVEGTRALRSHLETFGAGGRNVQTFNSRIRTKKEGRDAGGFGVAVGSHKSTTRLSAYKRGSERGGVEFQLTGAPVKAGVGVVNMLAKADHEPGKFDPWSQFRQQVFTIVVKDYEKSMGMSFGEMCEILTTGIADDLTERALRTVEESVQHMDLHALQVVQALVQERLALDFA
jgi:hypothetical protein